MRVKIQWANPPGYLPHRLYGNIHRLHHFAATRHVIRWLME